MCLTLGTRRAARPVPKMQTKKPAEAGRVWPSPSVGLVANLGGDLLCG